MLLFFFCLLDDLLLVESELDVWVVAYPFIYPELVPVLWFLY